MCPEAIEKLNHPCPIADGYDFKADVWSLGVLLYEIVSGGKMPFLDLSIAFDQAAHEMTRNILTQPPRPLPLSVSREVQELIWWMLEKDPNRRPKVSDVLLAPCLRGGLGAAIDLMDKFPTQINAKEKECRRAFTLVQECIHSATKQRKRLDEIMRKKTNGT